jgi:hypothetical protein
MPASSGAYEMPNFKLAISSLTSWSDILSGLQLFSLKKFARACYDYRSIKETHFLVLAYA